MVGRLASARILAASATSSGRGGCKVFALYIGRYFQFLIRQDSVLDVLRHVEDKRPFLCFQLAESFTEAVIDIVGVIDFHRRPGL